MPAKLSIQKRPIILSYDINDTFVVDVFVLKVQLIS